METQVNIFSPKTEYLNINSPLINVVVETSEKTKLSAAALFKNHYTTVVESIEKKNNTIYKIELGNAIGILCSTLVSATGAFLFNSSEKIAIILFATAFVIFVVTSIIFVQQHIKVSDEKDKNIQILTICDTIFEFSNVCKLFEKEPLEQNVAALFIKFEQLTELFKSDNFKVFENEFDFSLFTKLSKFHLMNEILELLKSEELADEWKLVLAQDVEFDDNVFWKKFKTTNPGIDACSSYLNEKQNIKPLKIRKQIVETFKNMIDNV